MKPNIQHMVRVEYLVSPNRYPNYKPNFMLMTCDEDDADALFAKWVVHIFKAYTPPYSSCIVTNDMTRVPNIQKFNKTFTFSAGKVKLAKVSLLHSVTFDPIVKDTIEYGDL